MEFYKVELINEEEFKKIAKTEDYSLCNCYEINIDGVVYIAMKANNKNLIINKEMFEE